MKELFGSTRTVIKDRYALFTPESLVPAALPGWEDASCVAVISPALGAGFCQFLIALGKDGHGRGNSGKSELFAYVVEGQASVTLDGKRNRLEAGSYVYIPPGKDLHFQGTNARLWLLEKIYVSLAGASTPGMVISHVREVKGQPLLGNEDLRCQTLLPDLPSFDLMVKIFTFQPGASLPFVSAQVMEHGILILSGQGICRLGAEYHPVRAGDVIWTAPYCPQWFGALGKTQASYICYQDANRDLM